MQLSDMSIYKCPSTNKKRAEEAEEISSLALTLSRRMDDLMDIEHFTPDPPDFVLRFKSGLNVGMELTELVRSAKYQRKGDVECRLSFSAWESEVKNNKENIDVKYTFSSQSLPEMFQQFERQFAEKQRKCSDLESKFTELWLVFYIPLSNPMRSILEYNHRLDEIDNIFIEHWGRFLWDTYSLFSKQEVFRALIFLSAASHLALTLEPTIFGGTRVNSKLLQIGQLVPDDTYQDHKSSVTRRIVRGKR